MKKALIITLLIAFSGGTYAQNWEFTGPGNFSGSSAMGVINHLLVHTDGKLFASSPDGGLWVNANQTTANWSPLSDYLPTLEVRSFDVSRQNSATLYLALKGSMLYKTTNGGTSWNQLPVDKRFGEINVVKVSVLNADLLFVGTRNGLFRSSDGGQTYTHLIQGEDVTDVKVDFTNPDRVFAGCRFVGVRRSVDGGGTWTLVQTSPVRSGTAPSMVKVGLGVLNRNGQAETPDTRTVVAKVGTNVYRSDNGGGTFARLADLSDSLQTEGGGGSSQRTSGIRKDWNNAVEINPFNSSEFYIGQSRFYKTTDRGNSFSILSAGHEDIQSIGHSAVATSSNTLFVANDGGVYRSENNGDSFGRFYTNLAVTQLLRAGINQRTIVANSDHNGIVGVEDYSATNNWKRIIGSECGYGNNGMEDNGVYPDPTNANQYYVFFTTLLRLNFPRTGTGCNGDILPVSPFVPYKSFVSPSSPQCGVVAYLKNQWMLPRLRRKYIWVARDREGFGTYGLMYTSQGLTNPTGTRREDVGNLPTWQEALDTGDDPIVNLNFHSASNTLYAITAKGKLYFTQPAYTFRNSWTERNSIDALPEIFDLEVPVNNHRKIYALSENTLYLSANQGTSWTPVLRNRYIPVEKYYSLVALADGVLLVSTSDGVYKTTTEGRAWQKINGNLPNVKVAQLVLDQGTLYAVTFGRGLWRIPVREVYQE